MSATEEAFEDHERFGKIVELESSLVRALALADECGLDRAAIDIDSALNIVRVENEQRGSLRKV